MEDGAVVVTGTGGQYLRYIQWKRPEPIISTPKIDITLDVKINGKDMSKEDKNKFMDYLKKFVNEVL